MNEQTDVLIRSYNPLDLPFILKSWIRTALAAKQFAGLTRPALVTAVQETIMNLLDRGAHLDVAVWSEDPSVIAGFVCYETHREFPLVHFCYTKNTFRNTGIGSTLIAHARNEKPGVLVFTFRNQNTKRVVRVGKYRPFLVRDDDQVPKTNEGRRSPQPRSAPRCV